MKKRVSITLAVVVVAVLLLGTAWQLSAGAVRHDVSSYEYDCFTGMETVWQEGNVLHLRRVGHTNVSTSENPELSGVNTTVADADVNLKTGVMVIRGTMSFQPEGIAGTWEGSWTFIYNKGVGGTGQGVAHGTGALNGKTLFLDLYDAEPDGNLEAECQGIGEPEGYTRSEGYVLETSAP
jgi:hypothetical protein